MNRPIKSTASEILSLVALAVGLAIALSSGFCVIQALIEGQTRSVGLLLGDSSMVDRIHEPKAFWLTIGILSVSVVYLPIAAIAVLREIIADHKRKIAAQKLNSKVAAKSK